MTNFDRVFINLEKLHPRVNSNFFTMPIVVEMPTFFKTFFKMDNYDEFLNKIKTDEKFKKETIKYVKNHFHQDDRYLLSSKDGKDWFFVEFKQRENTDYTLRYIESLSNLNKSLFLENYTDIFGNFIDFEVYS